MRRFFFWILSVLFFNNSYSESLISRGVVVGLPLGAIAKPGFLVQDIGVYISKPDRINGSLNTMANLGVIEYSTKTRWFDNQFRFIAAPVIEWSKGSHIGHSWHYGIPSPVFLVGLVHEIFPGLGISNFVGGFAPLRAGESQRDVWLFTNLTSISYTRDEYNLTLSMIYGRPSNDLSDNMTKPFPNFINLDFTATKILSGIEVGPIWFFSKDLNYPVMQQQFAIGGLVGFQAFGCIFQFWAGHDLFAYNYPQQTTSGYFRLKKIF